MRPPFRSPLAAAARPARSPAAAPAAGLDLAQDPAPTARSVGLLLEGLEPTDTIRVDGRAVPTPANRFLPLERGRYARVEVSRSGLSLGVGAELKAAPPRAVPLDTMTVLNGVAVSLVGWARLELIGFDPRTRFFVDTLPVETKADPSTGIFTLRIRLTGGPMALGALGPEGSVREGTVAPRPGDLLDVLFTDLSAAPRTPWYLQAGVPTLRPVVTPPTATPSPTAAAPQATPAATALQATPAPTQPPAPTGLAPTRAPSSIQSAPAAPSRGRAVGSLLLGGAAALAIGAVAVMSLRGAGGRRANPGSPWKPVRVWSTEEPDGTLLWRYSLRSRGGGVLIEGHRTRHQRPEPQRDALGGGALGVRGVVIARDLGELVGDQRREQEGAYPGGDRRGRGGSRRTVGKRGDRRGIVSTGEVLCAGRPPPRRGAWISASTVRMSASDGPVRLCSPNQRRISPEPIVVGSRVW